ncbi:MAG: type II toxin-antitoxin system VapC family toxin [Candidatus Dormibacter sp.]|uniref:type II toxin-antitoxin system VapC family toxin n=1 Tax=Candidatus Dormibacter sp. TaxID=2973982 RepID=UPI000DB4FA2B|nr:MAG: VapC toxin family PIN domain ribonuclease [Candidatus Dormibacteraeota bacterium]
MADLLVDTDVLIDHLRGDRRLSAEVGSIAISVISHCELFAGHDEPERLRRFLSPMSELPIDLEIAELAGVTRRNTGIATPDALVAATALTHRLPLMTRNRHHYDRVPKLRIITPV